MGILRFGNIIDEIILLLLFYIQTYSSKPITSHRLVYQSSLLSDGSFAQCYGTCAKQSNKISYDIIECNGKRMQLLCERDHQIYIETFVIGKMALDHILCENRRLMKCGVNVTRNITRQCNGREDCMIDLATFGNLGRCRKMIHIVADVKYVCKKVKKMVRIHRRPGNKMTTTTTAVPKKNNNLNDIDDDPFWLLTAFDLLQSINQINARSRHITLIVLFSVFLGMIVYLCYFLHFCKKEKQRQDAIAKKKKLLNEIRKNDEKERELLPPPDGFDNGDKALPVLKINKDEKDCTIPLQDSPCVSPSFSTDTSALFTSQNIIPPPLCLSPLSLENEDHEEEYFITMNNTSFHETLPCLFRKNEENNEHFFPNIPITTNDNGLNSSGIEYDASASGNDGNDSSLPTTPSIMADITSPTISQSRQRNPIINKLFYKLQKPRPKCKQKIVKIHNEKIDKNELRSKNQNTNFDFKTYQRDSLGYTSPNKKWRPYSQPCGMTDELDLATILDLYQSKSNRESRHLENEQVKIPVVNSFAAIDKNYFLRKCTYGSKSCTYGSKSCTYGSKSCDCNLNLQNKVEKEHRARSKRAPKLSSGYKGQIASIRHLYCPNGLLYPRFKKRSMRYPEDISSSLEKFEGEQHTHFIESGYQSNGTDSIL